MKKVLILLIIIFSSCAETDQTQAPKIEYDLIGTTWVAQHSWSKIERVGRDGTIRKRAWWIDRDGITHYYDDMWEEFMENDSMVNVNYEEILFLTFNDSKTLGVIKEANASSYFGGKITTASETYIYSFDSETLSGEWWTPIPGGKFNVSNFVIIPEKSTLMVLNQGMPDGNRLTFIKEER